MAGKRALSVDAGAFSEQVRDALLHLYDPVHLQSHPLAELLAAPSAAPGGVAGLARGRRLRDEIVDAIETLRGAAAGRAVRRYEALVMRYVDGLDVAVVTSTLALGRSQYYEEHRDAVEAVVSMLRERWCVDDPAPTVIAPQREPVAPGRGRLPMPLTSFVGRDVSVAAVLGHLAKARLVTLTGPPGIGKSRLALAVGQIVAHDRSRRHVLPDGVYFVALAPISDPSALVPTILEAVGAPELPAASPLAALTEHLRDRRALLVLDNFEHLVAAAETLAALLAACVGLRVLVTSRAPLRLPGEQVWPVPPLAMPDPTQAASPDQLGQYEAIALFVERSRAVRPSFALTAENAPAVEEICRRLDGVPLAIELAAARSRVLAPPQIAARLDEAFRLLGDAPGPPHGRTLRATIDWSYAHLSAGEQKLLGRLSTFAGGWSLDAAEAVCGDDESATGRQGEGATASPRPLARSPARPLGDGLRRADVLDLMTGLVDNSLVTVDEGAEPRYRLLEIVRQYARERLDGTADAAETGRRHLDWCVALCERTRPQDADPARAALISSELDNVRAALGWALANDAVEQGFRLVNSLTGFWYARARYAEGRGWVDALLAAPGGARRTMPRADALRTAGHLALRQCDFAAAARYQDEAASIAAELGDAGGLAAVAQMRARLAVVRGDLAEAQRLYRDVVAAEEQLGRRTWLMFGLTGLADALELDDRWDEAAPLAERALALARAIGSQQAIASALRCVGRVARHRDGAEAAAVDLFAQSLAIRHGLQDRRGASELLIDLAEAATARGDLAGARSLYQEGLRLAEEAGSWPEIERCRRGLGVA